MSGYAESSGPTRALEVRIAKVCHEANRALCQAFGDDSQSAWEDAPLWQLESAIKGVGFALDNPDATPGDQHNAWCEAKVADGWVYGPKKDPEAKTHPCMVPYGLLPPEQRAKDGIFRSIVKAMAGELIQPTKVIFLSRDGVAYFNLKYVPRPRETVETVG